MYVNVCPHLPYSAKTFARMCILREVTNFTVLRNKYYLPELWRAFFSQGNMRSST